MNTLRNHGRQEILGRHSDRGQRTVQALQRIAVVVFTAFFGHGAMAVDASKLAPYAFEDTKQLVKLVEDAAQLIETHGAAAFVEFAKPGSRWRTTESYLYVYSPDGTCLYHGSTPELVGGNFADHRDANGKPAIQRITRLAQSTERRASGWVFYLWQEGANLTPTWKSAYNRKVIAPDGTLSIVGAGLYRIKFERSFLKLNVDRAVTLLQSVGIEESAKELLDPASEFNFLDTYIYVLDENGRTVIDPAFPKQRGRDMSALTDAVGRPIIAELTEALKTKTEYWAQYLRTRPGDALPSRRIQYARRITLDGHTYIVGSDYFMATPIWMKP